MAKADWPRDARDPGPFDPALKCCTYEPFLPNFSIGRLLMRELEVSAREAGDSTDSTKGEETDHREKRSAVLIALDRAFARGVVTPLGLLPRESRVDGGAAQAAGFGRDPGRRCAFLSESATCLIWHDRPSVCRSYFCVSDQGEAGQAKWREAERKGNEAEWTLAHELLWEMGFTQDETSSFAEWRGREREFFIECAKRALKEAKV
jgi:Fe-S-cluster containining protein